MLQRPHLAEIVRNGKHMLKRPGLDGEFEHIIAHPITLHGKTMIASVVIRQRADGSLVMEEGMVHVQEAAGFQRRLAEGDALSDNLIPLPGGPAAYGGKAQRRALRNLVNRAKTPEEAEGIIFGFKAMREIGFELENVSLHYNDNQGLDMIFRNRNGDIAMIGAYAVLEAKRGGNLSAAKVSADELRQGSTAYNLDRIRRYEKSADPAHREMAKILRREIMADRLLSLISLRESGRLLLLPRNFPKGEVTPVWLER